jgi:hypothetical protein
MISPPAPWLLPQRRFRESALPVVDQRHITCITQTPLTTINPTLIVSRGSLVISKARLLTVWHVAIARDPQFQHVSSCTFNVHIRTLPIELILNA